MEMSVSQIKIILIEDSPGSVGFAQEILSGIKEHLFEIEHTNQLLTGLERLGKGEVDLILLHITGPDSRRFNRTGTAAESKISIVVLIGFNDKATAVEAIHLANGTINKASMSQVIRYAIERKQRENSFRQSERKLKLINQVSNIFLNNVDEQIYPNVLQLVLDTFESSHGIFGYFDYDKGGIFVVPPEIKSMWWQNCQMPNKNAVFHYGIRSGIWEQVVKEKKSLYFNQSPFNGPNKHIPIKNTLIVPIVFRDKVISLIHISNKAAGYNEKDKLLLEAAAAHIAPVLHARLERKKYEKEPEAKAVALQENKKASESPNVGVCLVNTKDRIIKANQVFCTMFGYKQTELEGMKMSSIIPPRSLKPGLSPLCAGNNSVEVERYINKQGQVVPGQVFSSLFWNDQGTPQYLVSFVQDVIVQRTADKGLTAGQNKLAQINARLEKRLAEEVKKNHQKDLIMIQQGRQAAMGEMLGHIAHQWRQPLGALNVLLFNLKDLINESDIDKGKSDKFFKTGGQLIKKMFSTMDSLMGYLTPCKEKETFSINRIVKESLSLVGPIYKHYNISTSLNEEQEKVVVGFPNEYSQVMLNLLQNAKDSIVERGVEGEIVIDVFEEDDAVVVSVKDNGGGVPEDLQNKIFDPFITTKEAGKGTGVGLYLSRRIIEEGMNGKITVHNLDNGAEFKVITPIVHKL